MPPSDPVIDRVILDFLARCVEDARRGEERGLAAYQALYPGHEQLIASEWARLRRGQQEPADELRRLGPYRLLEALGRGGQGVVYRAIDERIGRTVALKLLPGLAPEDGLPARVQREVEAIARLDHPGLGVVYEAGVHTGQVYLAMRYVPGLSLAQVLAERSAAGPERESRSRRDRLRDDVGLVEKLARALHAAHEAGVVHRDVKPANVMIHESGEPVLLDFGLARSDDSALETLTASGELLGTTAYMAPERLRGEGGSDRRVDVWALGVLLYELLTGRRPFEGPGLDELSRRIRHENPTDPRRLERGIPRDLAVVLGAALEKDPGKRYPTALALAEELARVRSGRPVHAQPPSPLGRLRRWAWRHPALGSLALVLLVTLAASLWAALAFAELADAERDAHQRSEELVLQLQLQQRELRETAARETAARREAEALLVKRGAEQAELLQLAGSLGRRWEMLDVLTAAARTRAALQPPLPDDLPSLLQLRELATSALLTPDARHDHVIQRSSLGAGRFSRDGTRLALTWVAPDFSAAGLRLLDTRSGDELLNMPGMFLLSDSFSVALSEDAARLIIPRSDAISLWRCADVVHLQQHAIPEALEAAKTTSRWEVSFLPGDRFFVGVGAPGNDPSGPHGWAIWGLDPQRLVQHQVTSTALNDWLALSPDDSHLLLPGGAAELQLLRLPVGDAGAPIVAELLAPAPVHAACIGPGQQPEIHVVLRPPGGRVDELARLDLSGRVLARRELPFRTASASGLLRRSPDGRHLALASARGDIELLDTQDLHSVLSIPAESSRKLEDLRFSADGRELLSHSSAEGSDAWRLLLEPGLEQHLPTRARPGKDLACSADGTLVAALAQGARAPQLARPSALVAESTDDEGLAADADEIEAPARLRSPDAAAGDAAPTLQLPDEAGALELVAVDAGAARVAALGPHFAWLWNLPDPTPRRLARPADGEALELAFDADGALLLRLRPPQGPERVLDLLTGDGHDLAPPGPRHWITTDRQLRQALLIPQQGVHPPSTLAQGELRWREWPGGETHALPGVPPESFRMIFSARFSEDGQRLAAVVYLPRSADAEDEESEHTRLMLWDLAQGRLLWTRPADATLGSVAPALAPDGSWVLLAEPEGSVALLDGRTGETLLRWQAHRGPAGLAQLQLLGDGARVLTRAADGDVRVWQLQALRRQLEQLGLGF